MTTKPIADEGWEVVSEETATKIIFDSFGDTWDGVKVGIEIIEMPQDSKGNAQEPFVQVLFRKYPENDGVLYGVNESYKLTKLQDIPDGKIVRMTYVKDVEVGKGNPMKDFRILMRELPAKEKAQYGL